jgi:hypothetical protein
MPTPPIYFPPTAPGGPPEGGTPPSGGDGGRWAYSPIYGWVWLPTGSGDKPHPPNLPQPPESGTEPPHVEHHG